MTAAEELSILIEKEFKEVLSVINIQTAYLELLEIVRQVETVYVAGGAPSDGLYEQKLFESVRFGWMRPTSIYLKNLPLTQQPLTFASKTEGKAWALDLLQNIGNLELASRWVTAEKACLVELSKSNENTFKIIYKNEIIEKEHYDRDSIAYVYKQMEKKNQNVYQRHVSKFKGIERQMLLTLQVVNNTFIQYSTTPDIDRYYSKLGYFHLSKNSLLEDFGNNDYFGGIPYKNYLRVLEEVIGVALKHFDYCKIAVEKNSKVDFFNILTHSSYENNTIQDFSSYLNIPFDQVKQIFSCLTLGADNICFHEQFVGNILPPYIRTGENQITRTFVGCYEGGIDFLKRELKRQFERDYFEAVNRRESRFRDDIYHYFKGNRFLTMPEEIEIKLSWLHTDIDAAVFDKKTGSLGLFQLKWQDIFFASLQERRSKINNLYPKAIEWIDKMERWTTSCSKKEILSKLKFESVNDLQEFENVYLFVITRNQVHFTGLEPDVRAAWATIFQMIESYDKYKIKLNDPLKELYEQIKSGLPSNRIKQEGYPVMVPHYSIFNSFQLDFQ